MVGFTVPKPNFRKDSGDVGRNSWQISYTGAGTRFSPSEQHDHPAPASISDVAEGDLPARPKLKILGSAEAEQVETAAEVSPTKSA